MPRESSAVSAGFIGYELLWRLAAPLLRMNHRLADGFPQRRGWVLPPRSTLWIQAASVGEAYLAREILLRLDPDASPLDTLLSANTRQGIDIHRETAALASIRSRGIRVSTAHFPFDQPTVAKRVVRRVRPAVAVFLETEIWPGLLRELRGGETRVLIVNGRISPRSLERYRLWPSVWRHAAPHHILATSEADARRFRRLFDTSGVGVMPNIKFDRLEPPTEEGAAGEESRFSWASPAAPLVVLGSVREAEEAAVSRMIRRLSAEPHPPVIGLFPRHLHRVDAWGKRLRRMGIPWKRRSDLPGSGLGPALFKSGVVLCDIIGELSAAYGHARAAFVGGSLAPLGGQNFIEAVMGGVIPVIGPSWEDFRWVGEAFFESGMARIAAGWRGVADQLVRDLENPQDRRMVRARAREYVSRRKGGAALASRAISRCLSCRRG